MHADIDPALAEVIEFVREVHRPIGESHAEGRQASLYDLGRLVGAVGYLLDAIDARDNQSKPRHLKAVS